MRHTLLRTFTAGPAFVVGPAGTGVGPLAAQGGRAHSTEDFKRALDGQTGRDVRNTGFALTASVICEPRR